SKSFKVYSLFSYQGALLLSVPQRQLIHYITSKLVCQQLFYFFCDLFPPRNQLDYNIARSAFCQQLFSTFSKSSSIVLRTTTMNQVSGEGGI
ncbi:MAG: hypothetical protein ACLT3H_12850, partial [Roseburia sp.]